MKFRTQLWDYAWGNLNNTGKKEKDKNQQLHFAQSDEVFSTLDFKKRTNEFYSKFAKDTLNNDIEKDMK